jgi:hypothetical protein
MGNMLIGGDAGFSYVSGEANVSISDYSSSVTRIAINPTIGYFIFDGLLPGAGIMYAFQSNNMDYSVNLIGPRIYLSYYFGDKKEEKTKMFEFLGLDGFYLRGIYSVTMPLYLNNPFETKRDTTQVDYQNSAGIGMYGGIEYFLEKNISLYCKTSFLMNWQRFEGPYNRLESGTQFYIMFGINSFIKTKETLDN